MSRIIIIIVLLCGCYSCQETPVKKKDVEKVIPFDPPSPLKNQRYMDSLIDRALVHGDKRAYAFAESHYALAEAEERFLSVALMVANKYNNERAHFMVYHILNGWRTHQKLDSLDPKTKDFALYHLLKAHELGEDNAKYEVEEIFGEGKPVPKSSYYMKEYAKE